LVFYLIMRAANKIAKNTIVSTLAEIVNKVISIYLYIRLANYLMDSGFGQFSTIVTLCVFFQIIASFGLDKLIIREISKNVKTTYEYLKNSLKIKLVLGLGAYFLLVGCILLMHKPEIVVLGTVLYGLCIFFINVSDSYMAVFNAHERLEINSFILVIVKLFIFSLVLTFIHFNAGLIQVLSAFLIGEIIRTGLFVFIFHVKLAKKVKSRTCATINKFKILKKATPFVIVNIAWVIYMKIDIIMLSTIKGDQAVGWYSAAAILLIGLMFISRCYTLSVFPALSRYARDSKELLSFSWNKSVKFLFLISFPLAVGIYLLSDRIIALLYDVTAYSNSINALKILIITLPMFFTNSINMFLFYALEKQKQATNIVLTCTACNIILNVILIPKYSFVGAAYATLFAQALNVSLFFGYAYFYLSMRPKMSKLILKASIACLFMGLLLIKIHGYNLFMISMLSAIVYLFVLIVLKTFDKDEIKIFKGIEKVFLSKIKGIIS